MSPRFEFFGGKGGVGKTTCAAARAVAAAKRGFNVLVVSTDPAHSLGDALGVRLSAVPGLIRPGQRLWDGPSKVRRTRGRPSKDRRTGNLHAVEIDAPRAFARWLDEHRQALGEVLEHGTLLGRDDVDALLDLSIPGVDELVGMLEIVRLASAPYDLIVVDTSPTGHTLRLLASPQVVAGAAKVLDALQAEHRIIREQLARVVRPEGSDRLIALLAQQAEQTGALIRDPNRSAFHWVMLPEELSLAETIDGLSELTRLGVSVAEIIVNRVIPDGPACPICDRLRAEERRVLASIPKQLGRKRAVRIVPAQIREPRGIRALIDVGRVLLDRPSAGSNRTRPARTTRRGSKRARSAGRGMAISSRGEHTTPPEAIDVFRGARLLLFGGKGGVGKTTTAAATALRLANAEPERRVLLMSTDPAHSLGDVLRAPVGDRPQPVAGAPENLHVRELDAPAALSARRDDIEAAVSEIMSSLGSEEGASATQSGVSELMDLAPPGIDELFGIVSVVESQDDYDLIVIDTAPTGHALRLLEMPDAARQWVQVLMRMVLKYRSLVRPGRLASELVDLSKAIRQLQDMLRDPKKSRFIVMTRAAEVTRAETERLIDRLRRLRIATPAMAINALTLGPGDCPRCRANARAERGQIAALARLCRRRRRECVIIQTPLAAPPPRGVAVLTRWAGEWTVHSRT